MCHLDYKEIIILPTGFIFEKAIVPQELKDTLELQSDFEIRWHRIIKWAKMVATNSFKNWDLQGLIRYIITYLMLLIDPHYLKCDREIKCNASNLQS